MIQNLYPSKNIYFLLIVLFILISTACNLDGATRTASVSGSWSNTATWGGNPVPVAGDNVIINSVVILSSGITATINDLTINSTGKLTVEGALILTGNLLMNFSGNDDSELVLSAGSQVVVDGNVSLGNKISINISSYFIVRGNFTKSGSSDQGIIEISGAHIYIFGIVSTPWSNFSSCGNNYTGTTPDISINCDYGNLNALVSNEINSGFPIIATVVQSLVTDVTNLTSPANCFCTGGNVTLTIGEAGAITWLKWYRGTTLLSDNTSPVSPYTFNLNQVGSYNALYSIGNNWYQTNSLSITSVPSPTLTGANQAATVCPGSVASINLSGLLPNSTSTVNYTINGIAQTEVTGVIADGSGAAVFTTATLTAANNGQTLQITGITVTSSSPNCSGTFTQIVTMSVNQATVGTPIFTLGATSTRCQGAGSVAYTATASDNTGIIYTLDATSLTGGNSIVAGTGVVTYTAGWSGTSIITASAAGCNGPKTAMHIVTISSNLAVSMSIGASANPVCSGTSVTFTAYPVNGGTTPAYQWKVNGINSGTNSATYSYVPMDNDAVTSVLTSNATCVSGNPSTSNTLNMTVYPLIVNNTGDYSNGIHGVICATANENANAVLTAPTGTIFINVGFASYGTPNGTCPAFTISSCNALTSQSVSEGYLLGNNAASIPATNGIFTDPCAGTVKRLYITATYSEPVCAGNSPGTISGTLPTGGNGVFTYLWESSIVGSSSGFTSASGTNNLQNYTPGILSQTTWYRRTVNSGGCSDVSKVILVRVNPVIADNTISSAQAICSGSVPLSLNGTVPTGGNGTYVYLWESSTISSSTGFVAASGTNSGQGYTPGALTQTTWYRRTVISGGCSSTSAAIQMTVTPVPSATIVYSGSPYCFTTGLVSVIQTGTTGGSYSSLPAGLSLNSATGEINTVLSTAGSYTITYTIAAAGGCGIFSTSTTVSIIRDLVWTGTISTNWNVPGNWSCPVIPDLTTNVQIPNVSNKPILGSGAIGAAKNIIIDNASSLTIIGNTIQISGTITNSGTFTATSGTVEMKGSVAQSIGANIFAGNTIKDLIINNSTGVTLQGPLNITGIVKAATGNLSSGGNLTLLSTAAQTALIDGSGTGNITGIVTMQRYLPSAFGYKYFSSPFQDATVSAFSPYLDLGASFPTFYTYDENRVSAGWVDYTSASGLLAPWQGYAANFGASASSKTVNISGVVNSNISFAFSLYNHNKIYTKGFNLVGNPYPSPIDWNAVTGWTKTNIDNAIYFFNSGSTDQYTGVYSSYINGVSTGNGNNIIASMQGFFVHVSDGTYPVNGSLGATNSVRTNDLNPLFKDAMIDTRTILRFTANFETKNGEEDVAVIYFDDRADMRFEKDLDALKMTNTDLMVPNLYSLTTETRQLSINGMPLLTDSLTNIPLGFTTLSDGWINFSAKDISQLPSSHDIYLVDDEKGVIQNLKQQPEYRFYLKAGVYDQRFRLVLSLSETNKPSVFAEKLFTITRTANILLVKMKLPIKTKGMLMVTNMSGQILLRRNVYEQEIVEISPNVSSGVYIVTVISGKQTASEKILIRKDYE